MRDYGKVYTKFWESDDIRSLSDDGRLLALYLMTCTHGTIAGVFRLPDGYVCEDTKWGPERVSAALSELLAKGFANRCETTKWVWVTKHLEWNPPENPNQRKAAVKVALSIPDSCVWKQAFMRACGPSLGIEPPKSANPSLTVIEGLPNQKQEQKQKQEENPSGSTPGKPARQPRGARFAPEDFEVTPDLQAWAAANTPQVDWRLETDKFRDWEFKHARTDWAKVWRTWMRKAQETASQSGGGRGAGHSVLAGAV
jgi:hypothetical protein